MVDIDFNLEEVVASVKFRPAMYILVWSKDDRFNGDKDLEANSFVWTLNPRIDRSFKGKDDDVAVPVLYLTEQEADHFFNHGFAKMEF